MGSAAAQLAVPLFHSLYDLCISVSFSQRPCKSKLMLPSLGSGGPHHMDERFWSFQCSSHFIWVIPSQPDRLCGTRRTATLEPSHRLRPRARLASALQIQLSYTLIKIIFLLSYKKVLQQIHHFMSLKGKEMSVGE